MSSDIGARATKGWLAGSGAATAVIAGFAWTLLLLSFVSSGDLGRFAGGTAAILLMAVLVFLVTCLLTGFPVAAVDWFSERFAIRSIWFFGCAGAGIGALSEAILFASFGRAGPNFFTCLFAVAGCVGGMVYWRVAARLGNR